MKLYATPMSCSFAAHVACLEAGLPHTLHWVARGTKLLADGQSFVTLSPKGVVPALGLADGTLLTETAAVLQLVADRAPDTDLAPKWGTPERYRLIEWLNFISSELHGKHLAPIFGRTVHEDVKTRARDTIAKPLGHVAKALESSQGLVGDQFTVADSYLFWALLAAPHGGVSLEAWPSLGAYVERHRARPSVQKALSIEGPLYLQEQRAA